MRWWGLPACTQPSAPLQPLIPAPPVKLGPSTFVPGVPLGATALALLPNQAIVSFKSPSTSGSPVTRSVGRAGVQGPACRRDTPSAAAHAPHACAACSYVIQAFLGTQLVSNTTLGVSDPNIEWTGTMWEASILALDPGEYRFTVAAVSRNGQGPATAPTDPPVVVFDVEFLPLDQPKITAAYGSVSAGATLEFIKPMAGEQAWGGGGGGGPGRRTISMLTARAGPRRAPNLPVLAADA